MNRQKLAVRHCRSLRKHTYLCQKIPALTGNKPQVSAVCTKKPSLAYRLRPSRETETTTRNQKKSVKPSQTDTPRATEKAVLPFPAKSSKDPPRTAQKQKLSHSTPGHKLAGRCRRSRRRTVTKHRFFPPTDETEITNRHTRTQRRRSITRPKSAPGQPARPAARLPRWSCARARGGSEEGEQVGAAEVVVEVVHVLARVPSAYGCYTPRGGRGD